MQTSSLSPLYFVIPVSVIFCMAVSFFGVYLKYYHKQLRQPSFFQFQFLRWKRTNNGQYNFIKLYYIKFKAFTALISSNAKDKKYFYHSHELNKKFGNLEYHSNTTTQRNQGNDNVIPITVFPPNSVLEIPSIMEDNPSYFSMEFLIQVKFYTLK